MLQNAVPLSEPKPSRSWTVAPNYRICETLLDLTLQVADEVFGLVEGVHYHLRRSFPRSLDFKPMGLNHQLLFLSADNPEHFVSTSITHWRWSEVGVSKPLVFEKLQDRLRDKRAKVLQSLCDGSPEGLNHYHEWAGFGGWDRDALDTKRNFRKFRLETGDNVQNLAPGYLEALRSRYAYSPDRLLSYEKGIFTNLLHSSAYWEFVESRNVVSGVKPSPHLPILLTWDFNVSPLAWVVLQEFTIQRHYLSPRGRQFVALAESNGEARGLMDGVADFAAQFPVHLYGDTTIDVYGDASGFARNLHSAGSDYSAIEQYLRALGYRRINILAARSNPLVKHRLEKTAALMAYERFAVDATCRRLIQSLIKCALKEGTFEIEKPSGEDWTHFADACTYCLFQASKDIDVANPRTRRVLGASM